MNIRNTIIFATIFIFDFKDYIETQDTVRV